MGITTCEGLGLSFIISCKMTFVWEYFNDCYSLAEFQGASGAVLVRALAQ
jgi:hypothetical protein